MNTHDRILVIVPSRGRPASIQRLQRAWDDTTTGYADLVTYVDLDDPKFDDYMALESERFPLILGPRRRLVSASNAVSAKLGGQYFALGSMGDDHLPVTPGWDKAILDALHEMRTGLAYPNDGWRGQELPTACFMTTDIVQALGYMAPPSLVHMFCDDFWRDLGTTIERLTYLPDVLIEHLHPHAGKAPNDQTYGEANGAAAFEADHVAYRHYLREQFEDDVVRVREML